jgi:hypothetical protein
VAEFILSILDAVRVFLGSRGDTALEALALRRQVAVLKPKRPRPHLNRLDRLFGTTLRSVRPRWEDALVIVKPETIVGWRRAGFRLSWRWRSRPRRGRPNITAEIRVLIRRLAQENLDWGAPKIPGELRKFGFDFLTVPTVTFKLLYCFFVIAHGRRKILHFKVADTRLRSGSSNNCGRPVPKLAHIDMSSSTTTRSLTPMSSRS